MTKSEALRRAHLERALLSLGFLPAEVEALRRISNTLRRWYELECGTGDGCIVRDETYRTPYWYNARARYIDPRARRRIPDREEGALRRLAAIIGARNARTADGDSRHYGEVHLRTYIQTDPRGAALYILRPGDVPEGCDPAAYYTRGVCVY